MPIINLFLELTMASPNYTAEFNHKLRKFTDRMRQMEKASASALVESGADKVVYIEYPDQGNYRGQVKDDNIRDG